MKARTGTLRKVCGRVVISLFAVSTAMGLALASAPMANAAQEKIRVEKSDSRIVRITGTSLGDSVVPSGGSSNGSGTQIRVSATVGQLVAGPGCVQLGSVVQCDGVSRIKFIAGSGDDAFRNDTGLPVQLEGGPGSDRLSGGPANDAIIGGEGNDFAFGRAGIDTCTQAENESDCEL